MSAPDLSALVSARLCHDLISPMGAIGNGLELLQLAGGAGRRRARAGQRQPRRRRSPSCASTASPSARPTRRRGSRSTRRRRSPTRCSTAASPSPGSRGDRDLPRPLARLVYLAILCLEKSLPMGGHVRVGRRRGRIALAVEGRRTAPPAGLWAHVTDGAPVARAPARRRAVRAAAPGARRPRATGSTARFAESRGRDRHRRSARRWPKPGPEARHVARGSPPPSAGGRRSPPPSGRAPPCPAARPPARRRGSPCPR